MTPATVRAQLAEINAELDRLEPQRRALLLIRSGLEAWLVVAEPAPNIPVSIPAEYSSPPSTASDNGVAAFIEAPFGTERTEVTDAAAFRATTRREAPTAVPGEPHGITGRSRALASPTETCDPGCGGSFALGTLGRHRAGCNFWLTYRTAHTRDVTDPNWPKPLPADDEPAREAAFVARRAEAASAKAAKTWVERHGGEAKALTVRQTTVMNAVRTAQGNIGAANRALGLSNGSVRSQIEDLRRQGRLPADVATLVDARRAVRAGAKA